MKASGFSRHEERGDQQYGPVRGAASGAAPARVARSRGYLPAASSCVRPSAERPDNRSCQLALMVRIGFSSPVGGPAKEIERLFAAVSGTSSESRARRRPGVGDVDWN